MKEHKRHFLVFFIGIMILPYCYVQAESLPEAIQHVLQTNPEIRTIAFNRLARDQEIVQAKSDYYPSLDLSYGAGVQNNQVPFDDKTWPDQTVLSLRQNVFRGLATLNEVKRQKARVKSSAYLLQGTSEGSALTVSRAYLNVLRQLEIYELSKENVVIHERIHDQIKLRSESGLDRKADLDQVEGRLALAKSDVIVTEANVIDAETDYLAVVGRMPVNLIKPQPVDSAIPSSMEEAQRLAVKNQPILKSAEADLEAREAQHSVAKSPIYPIVDITVDQKWENDVDDFPGYNEELLAMAVVRFNIFRGFKDKGRIAETSQLINEAREIRNNTYREVIESIRLSWASYMAASNKIKYLENYVSSTSETAMAFQKQWNIGKRTMFDVLDIEAELINSKIELVDAQYDKTYSQYRVIAGLGKLVHTIGLQWPEESQVGDDEMKAAAK
jgi:adhesin transport system outer membrane protein